MGLGRWCWAVQRFGIGRALASLEVGWAFAVVGRYLSLVWAVLWLDLCLTICLSLRQASVLPGPGLCLAWTEHLLGLCPDPPAETQAVKTQRVEMKEQWVTTRK